MSRQERSEYIKQLLLAIQFDDGNNYTSEELNAMSDEELQTAYDAETGDEKETCSICEEVKVCDYADDDTGEPICEDCANEISDSVPTNDGEGDLDGEGDEGVEPDDEDCDLDGGEAQDEDDLEPIDGDSDLDPDEPDEDDEDQDDTEEID